MKKNMAIISTIMLLAASVASASVTVTTDSASLVTSPMSIGASSSPLGLFSFTLGADAGETLSSVTVQIKNEGSSTATGSDFTSVSVYRDNNANGTFQSGTDLVAGAQSSVNVGSDTTVNTASNNALPGTFFVALSTSSSWGNTAPLDSVTVEIDTDGVVTSADSPTITKVDTDVISATTSTPDLTAAVADNSGSNAGIGAGDKVKLTFSADTNKPSITDSNIDDVLTLSSSHSWLDGAGHIGSVTWNSDGNMLTITISAGTSVPTVTVGDTITIDGSVIKDVTETHNATGSEVITGSFTGNGGEGDDEDNGEHEGQPCTNTLINGRLYKLSGDQNTTVYLAAGCVLKPFRGAAVFHARGGKFLNIIVLSSLDGFTISDHPALPADGTLVKGSDKTVWFIEHNGKRKGFASAAAFLGLGFRFDQVNQISDDDLNTIDTDSAPVTNDTEHPDGSLIKCGNSATIFQIIGGVEFPFTNLNAFELRGHSFEHVANVDCGRFHYTQGTSVQ